MRRRVPALIGGAVAAATAAAAAGVAFERHSVSRQRARIDARTAARFGALPVDRESVVVTEDGLALYVEEVGPLNAPLTVVFVHGFTLNLGSFHFQRIALSDAFGDRIRMVFYDQRSHGRSGHSDSKYCTLEQLGRDLNSVIEARMPVGPIVLVGHSMGAMAVMEFARQFPTLLRSSAGKPKGRTKKSRISAIALINTSAGQLRTVTLGLPNVVARLRGPVVPIVLRRAARSVHLVERGRALGKDLAWVMTKRLSFGSPDVDPAVVDYAAAMIAATPVDVVSDFYSTLMDHDGTEGVERLAGCEVLLIGGTKDTLTPISHTEAIAAALPKSELIMVEDAGHLLMLEKPESVDGPLIALIESQCA
jgi:pimeloyl-ACP methyl ester carboxylesterase